MSSISNPIRIGVAGLGRAFALSATAIHAHPGVILVAGAEPNSEHRRSFEKTFDAKTYTDVSNLVTDPDVEVVYVSTPHGLHKEHALAAINAGKSVLIEKPMTVSLEDASSLIEAAKKAGVQIIVGPSHSFDGPVKLAEVLIAKGKIGRVRMIHALYATDFLYRPRTASELSTDLGGGVVFSQAVHQVDLVRRLAGVPAQRVTARTGGVWDADRPTEGAYSMLIDFNEGIFASLTYSGYAHFDGDRLMENTTELGISKSDEFKSARKILESVQNESEFKSSRGFSSLETCPQAQTHEHFGQVFVFGDRGDLRLTPNGVEITDANGPEFYPAPFRTSRAEVFDTLYAALREQTPPLQNGKWGRASLEICHALLTSSETGDTVTLNYQEG
ncbi:Gfo/Idh/MocA family oxidoreductase [Marinomonas profundi]|uniref:Gfo/Idh/MocA family protein n=1 Tax=Marinomonas profundi TaxID=2726122 RepID=UPI001B3AC92D|nr:Gfo/Idh/MocA family oxidoreductase [Marinomonas profundi]UDV04049.1 Gfo/Idh/MocA family oxidoreductase [Marinomonas profundi]